MAQRAANSCEGKLRDSFEFKIFGLLSTRGQGPRAIWAATFIAFAAVMLLALEIGRYFSPSP
jgi:hypothetical protein